MTYTVDISPEVLDAGRWVNDRGIQRWIANPLPGETPEPQPKPKRDVTGLIACPTCHAKTGQTCRTKSGHTTTPHFSRLAPRLCQCGAVLRSKARYCPPCRYEVNLANKRDYLRRLRARRKAERSEAA